MRPVVAKVRASAAASVTFVMLNCEERDYFLKHCVVNMAIFLLVNNLYYNTPIPGEGTHFIGVYGAELGSRGEVLGSLSVIFAGSVQT